MTTLVTPLTPTAGRPGAASRVRPAPLRFAGVVSLLAGTAIAYLWSLSASGYANSFYAAAAQAGSQSWKAWFFGSLDAGNAITVDKPPAALWVMGLSVRLFGLSSWSILVPEALMGVGTVALVYLGVRRLSGEWPALAAGLALALTPAAALMFRFDNPDALLLLLLVAAGHAVVRSLERASTAWLLLAGALVGFGFLTKMLQAFLVLPAFALVYLLAAPTPLRRRLWQLVAALAAVVAGCGWWIAIVELWPAASRPYVDGSTTNSVLQLAFGYNGLGRVTGNETGGHGNAGFSSGVGPLRLFEGVSGGMVAWLLPAALVLLVAGIAYRRGAPRTDAVRAVLLLNGGVLLVTGAVFSFMEGIYHDYYVIALAPWIVMTAAVGAAEVWRHRSSLVARGILAATILGSTVWSAELLGQSGAEPYSSLRFVVATTGVMAAGLTLVLPFLPRALAGTLAGLVLVTGLAGPASYTIDTIATPHAGSIVTAGPVSSLGGPGGARFAGGPAGARFAGGPAGGLGGARLGGQVPGGMGGMGDSAGVDSQLATALKQGSYRWAAATTGAQSAASYELATGTSVMAIGGFNGTTPSITLAQFQQDVAQGQIHYFIAGGGFGGGGLGGRGFGGGLGGGGFGGLGAPGGPAGSSSTDASEITSWVEQHFTSTTIGSTTVYDLTRTTPTGTNS